MVQIHCQNLLKILAEVFVVLLWLPDHLQIPRRLYIDRHHLPLSPIIRPMEFETVRPSPRWRSPCWIIRVRHDLRVRMQSYT